MPPARTVAARGHLLSGIAQKVGKEASPCTPLHPPVLATGGMRQRHTIASLSLRRVCARGRIYDRPLLRSSARAEGAFGQTQTALRVIHESVYEECVDVEAQGARLRRVSEPRC